MRECEMLELLRQKYTRIRPGTNADRYVRAAHVRMQGSYSYGFADRIADYIVIDTYTPQQVIGFEVKVSRADWLTELRDPSKADTWRKYCHRRYLVVPDMAIVRDDLPDGWGLMALTHTGKLAVRTRAAETSVLPMSAEVIGQLGRSIAKTAAKEVMSDV